MAEKDNQFQGVVESLLKGMVENLSMISGIGHLSMRKWEKG